MSSTSPFAIAVYVRILDEVEFFGVHDFQMVPRTGETVELSRHDVDHTLEVLSVKHNIKLGGHGVTITCR